MICFLMFMLLFILIPKFIKQTYLYLFGLLLLALITVISLYDINFNCRIYCNKIPNAYEIVKTEQKSYLTNLIYVKSLVPIFIIQNKIYTRDMSIVPLQEYETSGLITVTGSDDMKVINLLIKNTPATNIIKKISIIDNRRCKVTFYINDKKKIVDFPAGKPDIKYFLFINKVYNLTDNFDYIDFRYNHFIVGKKFINT